MTDEQQAKSFRICVCLCTIGSSGGTDNKVSLQMHQRWCQCPLSPHVKDANSRVISGTVRQGFSSWTSASPPPTPLPHMDWRPTSRWWWWWSGGMEGVGVQFCGCFPSNMVYTVWFGINILGMLPFPHQSWQTCLFCLCWFYISVKSGFNNFVSFTNIILYSLTLFAVPFLAIRSD